MVAQAAYRSCPSKHYSGQREASAGPWLSTTQSTAALARWTQLATISKNLAFVERAGQGHQRHTEPKDDIKIPVILGGRLERKSKNLTQNKINQKID